MASHPLSEHSVAAVSDARASRPWSFLLADDGSLHSSAGAALLTGLALPPGSQVTIVSVLTPRETSSRILREQALEAVRARFTERGVHASVQLVSGHPAEQLLEITKEVCPDLIVIGARGLRSALDILVGGVAQQVLEYGQFPLLLVRPPYEGLNRILLVTDGSPHSRQGAAFLGGSAARPPFPLLPGAQVHVAHVLPPLPSVDMLIRSWSVGPELIQPLSSDRLDDLLREQAEEEQREGEALVAGTVAQLQASGIAAEPVLLRGDPAGELIDYARSHDIDLIVAGSRGLSPVKAWLLGSVSRKLVYYAGCSVLVVKGPQQTSQ